eukprot:jgi/Ulvmu1/4219/UM019_0198.1
MLIAMRSNGLGIRIFVAFGLLAWQAGDACAATSSRSVASVATARQLREALELGVQHVVINDHIDLTDASGDGNQFLPDNGVLAIRPPGAGVGYGTESIRGNCSNPEEPLPLDPPPKPHQCVVTVHAAFIDVPQSTHALWLSALYLRLAGPPQAHSALVSTSAADLYLTDVTLDGTQGDSRGVHVNEDSSIFVCGSHFSGFTRDVGAAVILAAGARATIVDTTFADNTALYAGPAMGLCTTRANNTRSGAATWFHNCRFTGNAAVQPADVSVEDEECRVYTDTKQPSVWDAQRECKLGAWPLHVVPSEGDGGDATEAQQPPTNVFADVEIRGRALPCAHNPTFLRIVGQQARQSGMATPEFRPLPDRGALETENPYDQLDGLLQPRGIVVVAIVISWNAILIACCVCMRRCGFSKPVANPPRREVPTVNKAGHKVAVSPLPQPEADAVQPSKVDSISSPSMY